MTGRERGGEPIGLYLHIPFCRSKCPFCDFCSFPRPDAAMVEAYVDELIRRIRLSGAAEAAGGVQALDTVYIGGGTPTLLTQSQAARLMEAVHAAFFVLPDAEVTVEGNPAALTAEGLAAFRAGGVNRLSLGVQSANADELRALGRLHSFPDAVRAVETARAVGIGNISLDFMIGIPGQTPDSLRRTLEAALALEPEVLLMDEPTSALDPISTSKIEELMEDLKKKYTVVVVTHNMQQALRVSDDTAFFLVGEMVEYGDTKTIFSYPKDKRTEDYITGRFG